MSNDPRVTKTPEYEMAVGEFYAEVAAAEVDAEKVSKLRAAYGERLADESHKVMAAYALEGAALEAEMQSMSARMAEHSARAATLHIVAMERADAALVELDKAESALNGALAETSRRFYRRSVEIGVEVGAVDAEALIRFDMEFPEPTPADGNGKGSGKSNSRRTLRTAASVL